MSCLRAGVTTGITQFGPLSSTEEIASWARALASERVAICQRERGDKRRSNDLTAKLDASGLICDR